jgi:hypothetical protein
MGQITSARPSPAILVAVLALVAALGGTALAGPDALTRALSKKQVKQIATKQAIKQIDRRAPGLSVAKAAVADTATNATTAENSSRLGGVDAAAYVKGPVEPVRRVGTAGNPPFGTNWTNVGAPSETAGFYKDPFGIVHLVGDLFHVGSANGEAVFTLPPAYRPSTFAIFAVAGNADGETATLRVDPDGDVVMFGVTVSGGTYNINGVTFRP